MNMEQLRIQQSFFPPKDSKQNEIKKWLKDIEQFNQKSIYDLSWKSFYEELHKLGQRRFLHQYGFSYKGKLQQTIAKSGLSQKKLSLYDFEANSKDALFARLGTSFFDKITPHLNFNPKNHKLSTIHYYLHGNNLYFTALSLGFSSKQSFLNFFAQTLYVSECISNKAQNLRMSIQSLYAVDPIKLRKELGVLYDKPLPRNMNFIRYNYTLEELKLALETEDIALVVASLGGGNTYAINKKLQTLTPLIKVSLHDLKVQSWASLKGNTPIFIWKIKLYQLFSGQIPIEQQGSNLFRPEVSYASNVNFNLQFFASSTIQVVKREQVDSPSFSPSF